MANNIHPDWNFVTAVGLDVSTWSTGWALWHKNELRSGAVQPPKKMSDSWARLRYMHDNLPFLMADPVHVFIEAGIQKRRREQCAELVENLDTGRKELITHRDKPIEQRTLQMLGEARGALITAIPNVADLHEISPSTWKSYFKCFLKESDAEKYATWKMMCSLWGRTFPKTINHDNKLSYDETDAVAILSYGLYQRRTK